MADTIRNQNTSVRARLQNVAKQRNQLFQLLLTRYVLERLRYRLSTTAHRNRFVLEGAMLMTTWFSDPFRRGDRPRANRRRVIALLALSDTKPDRTARSEH